MSSSFFADYETFQHDMCIIEVDEDGVITGKGGYPAGDGPPYGFPYNWQLTGAIHLQSIELTLDYESDYTATVTGEVADDWRFMSGGAGSDSSGVTNWEATKLD